MWRGEDEVLQRHVAVKEILVPLAGAQNERDSIRARVLREARALARLNHPSIVAVHDVVEEAERHWIIMELVDAESLGDVIRNHGPLPPNQVAAIGLALIEALGAAHQKGVLHRDVKPGNVLLGRDGRVRLTDFGIAATEGDMTLTGTGALVGSPAYIAPERIRGSSGTPSSDLWGLGATLYSAVEGSPPYEGPETYAVLSAVVEGRRRPFRNAGPLRPLLADLLDKAAEERPDAGEIRQRLVPIARNSEPVPMFVVNGPSLATAEGGNDDAGLENVSGTDDDGTERGGAGRPAGAPVAAAHLRALEEEISSTNSDELSGLEAVSEEPFAGARGQGGRRRSSDNRRSLMIAAIAAAVVVAAAIVVSLLLTGRDQPADLPHVTVDDTSSVSPTPTPTFSSVPAVIPTEDGPTAAPTRHGTTPRTNAPPTPSATLTASPPASPPTSAPVTTSPSPTKSPTGKPSGGSTPSPTVTSSGSCEVPVLCPANG
ncbi:protein kinase domain-containing protein [Pseudofrankia asymbiotica]|uniref:protein kinase domain-containing protein n=1 Tax=Pseudofrankia asymbiotica TaxID=1834516 RepID=UPI0026D535CD